ncbi:MAG TPA: sigma-70 family RNA polymerase sigma factor [Jiangellaceae bacterium]
MRQPLPAHAVAIDQPIADQLTQHRPELVGYCYRMLGSVFDAEDAVQEALVRAWRAHDRFEGRASLRSWLYRIATNVCLDFLDGKKRRARPMDLSSPAAEPTTPGDQLPDSAWIEPIPDNVILSTSDNPAEAVVSHETVQLAFVAALQYLPPRQRAVLLLRDVVGLSAREVSELMGSKVTAVTSALQRARSTLAARRDTTSESASAPPLGDTQRALLLRYVDAFERFDMDALTMLLHIDATLSLPPYTTWMQGPAAIRAWLLGPGVGCRGSKLIRTVANGSPAVGQYRPSTSGDGYEPWALQVIEVGNGRIKGINAFRDTDRWFPLFGLPSRLG